jgi:hypothetical protein
VAKFTLKAGGEIDVLTSDELADQIDRLEQALRHETEQPMVRRQSTEVTTDASGNISGGIGVGGSANVVYQVPTGYIAFVHRLNSNAPGYTPAAPLTTGGVIICRNANLVANTEMFLPVSGVVAPVLFTAGSNSALWLNGGDQLVIGGGGLPVSIPIIFTVQVRLWRAAAHPEGVSVT